LERKEGLREVEGDVKMTGLSDKIGLFVRLPYLHEIVVAVLASLSPNELATAVMPLR